jgi:hypothetical protein
MKGGVPYLLIMNMDKKKSTLCIMVVLIGCSKFFRFRFVHRTGTLNAVLATSVETERLEGIFSVQKGV